MQSSFNSLDSPRQNSYYYVYEAFFLSYNASVFGGTDLWSFQLALNLDQ